MDLFDKNSHHQIKKMASCWWHRCTFILGMHRPDLGIGYLLDRAPQSWIWYRWERADPWYRSRQFFFFAFDPDPTGGHIGHYWNTGIGSGSVDTQSPETISGPEKLDPYIPCFHAEQQKRCSLTADEKQRPENTRYTKQQHGCNQCSTIKFLKFWIIWLKAV